MNAFLKKTIDGRNWVFPQSVKGRLSTLRTRLGTFLIVLLLVVPLVRIQGRPLLLLDIANRRFTIGGIEYWPQDSWLLLFLLLTLLIGFLLMTALWGRIWCGFACPQTVFMHQVYFRIEQWFEGDRGKRIRFYQEPWTARKIIRKSAKHLVFLAVSSMIAHSLLAYFMPTEELLYALLHPSMEHKTAIILTTLTTIGLYLNFAYFREQFCNYLCPYARFQSALLDPDSLIVAYDTNKGETRGFSKTNPEEYGACIDCKKCVNVCPQGIDIRDGLQLDCIHCGLCIDACVPIMENLGREPDLIRYASENELKGKSTHFWRGRTLVYAVVTFVFAAAFAYSVVNRRVIEVTTVRPAGISNGFTVDGKAFNRFQLKLVNKDRQDRFVFVRPLTPGYDVRLPHNPIDLKAGSRDSIEMFVVRTNQIEGNSSIQLLLTPGKGQDAFDHELSFLAPARKGSEQ